MKPHFTKQFTKEIFSALLYKKSALKEAIKELGDVCEFEIIDSKVYGFKFFLNAEFSQERCYAYITEGAIYYRIPDKWLLYPGAVIVHDAYGFSLYHRDAGCSLNELDHRAAIADAITLLESNNYLVIHENK